MISFLGAVDLERSIAHPSVEFSTAVRLYSSLSLHNREDLLRVFRPLNPHLSEFCSDSELVLEAYRKWGLECAPMLEGDFSFAVWDEGLRRLFCCRDRMGAEPFFYCLLSRRVLFANDPSQLLRGGVPRELNRRKLLDMTVPGGQHFRGEETFHRGILSLPPGHCMTIDLDGLKKWEYWDPVKSTVQIPRRETEIYEQLRDLLFNAVDQSIGNRRRPAAFLSGGLDSSAVVAIAARLEERKNRTLLSFSSVLPEQSSEPLKDEKSYIEEFRAWQNIDMRFVTAPGRGPFDRLDDDHLYEMAFTRHSRHFLAESFQEAGMSEGVDVFLDGIGGELGPTNWGGSYYLELATRFRLITLTRELWCARKIRKKSPFRILGGQFLMALTPNRAERQAFLWAPEFQRESLATRRRRPVRWPDHRADQVDLLSRWRAKHANVHDFWRPNHIPARCPLMDRKVLEFCIASPGCTKVRNGYSRWLIRRALDGVLPARIQWRTTKGPFSPDYFVRYNAQLHVAQDFVARIGSSDPVRKVVDIPRLNQLLKPVDPVKGSWEALASVPTNLYLIAFLRQFPEYRP